MFIRPIANSRTTKISLLCHAISSDFYWNFRPKFTAITNVHLIVSTLQPANFPHVAYFEIKLQMKYHWRFDLNLLLVCGCVLLSSGSNVLPSFPLKYTHVADIAPESSWSEEIIKLQRLANHLLTFINCNSCTENHLLQVLGFNS